jgi:hypothetical protein
MLSDLRRWRKKSARLVKAGKSPACDFESEFISASMTAAIQGQLDAVEDVDGVREVFDRIERDLPGRNLKTEDDMQIHTHIHLPESMSMKVETSAPNVNVNVEPTPITVETSAPAVNVNVEPTPLNIENKMDMAPVAKALKAKDKSPKMTGRIEETVLDRDRDGRPKGSRSRVRYEYEE